jgi:NTP pyrophosphatase (non-canonical NTP hydrolase)
MDAEAYLEKAMRTSDPTQSQKDMLTNAALGLAGESGEINDLIKKWIFHGHTLDTEKLKMELGDLLWYVGQAVYALDLDMSTIMQANIDKLLKRYPDKFSHERSINRED